MYQVLESHSQISDLGMRQIRGEYLHENFCVYVLQAIDSGSIQCVFRGVALGDSWISPIG